MGVLPTGAGVGVEIWAGFLRWDSSHPTEPEQWCGEWRYGQSATSTLRKREGEKPEINAIAGDGADMVGVNCSICGSERI